MRNKTLITLSILAMISLSAQLAGCIKNNESDSLADVALAADVDKKMQPINPTDVFNTDVTQVFCTFKPKNVPSGTKITATWIFMRGEMENYNINYVISEWTEAVKSQGNMAMFLRRPTKGWPKGEYKVVLSVNEREELSIPFKIK